MIGRFVAENVAPNKPATQISTYFHTVASRAVDGHYNTGSCTHSHVHPWWSLDLRASHDVVRVTVTNDGNTYFSEQLRTYFKDWLVGVEFNATLDTVYVISEAVFTANHLV